MFLGFPPLLIPIVTSLPPPPPMDNVLWFQERYHQGLAQRGISAILNRSISVPRAGFN